MNEDKDKIIRGVYHDADDGFGSINDTYNQSHRILNTITLTDVRNFLNRQKSRQTKTYRGFNSYVAKEPLQEIQADIADFARSAEVNDDMIHQRLDGLGISKEKWVDILPSVLKKYNNTSHPTAGMKPNEAKKKDNHFDVWLTTNSEATYNRKYKQIKVGDKIRTCVKPENMKKGNVSVWSPAVYTIAFIKDKQYLINGHRQRVWNRWELLKIESAEGKDG